MNKPIYLALGFLGALLVASIAFAVLIPKGDTTAQATFVLPTRPSQTSSPSFSLLGEALPSPSPTIDLSQSRNCIYTGYFWRNHPEAWPEQVEVAGQSIPKNLAAQWMQSPAKDAVLELQRVLYVTLLNIGSGADRSAIDKTIRDASDWLASHHSGGAPSEFFDQSTAVLFINTLEDYNNGLVGPELCPNQPKTPRPTATALIQVEPGETTLAPSATPSPSQKAAALTSTPLVPVSGRTATLSPTREPQQPPTSTPTRPVPTPKPPTATPLPPSSTLLPPSLTPAPSTLTPMPTLVPPSSTPAPVPSSTQTPEPSASPSETPTHRPTRTLTSTPEPSETPTSTSTHRPTHTPTSTPEPPTDTVTPEPTSTSTPEPTSTSTPEPTITETPEPTSTETPRVKPTHPS